MVKIDKELDTMEANVMKMARQVISMHEKVVEVLENPDSAIELDVIIQSKRSGSTLFGSSFSSRKRFKKSCGRY